MKDFITTIRERAEELIKEICDENGIVEVEDMEVAIDCLSTANPSNTISEDKENYKSVI